MGLSNDLKVSNEGAAWMWVGSLFQSYDRKKKHEL